MHGISHDDSGSYVCHECGATWHAKNKWLLWPAEFRLSRNFAFGIHGVETEPNGAERRVFKTIVSIGFLRVVLGNGYKSKVEWAPEFQAWIPKRKGFFLVEKRITEYLEKITD